MQLMSIIQILNFKFNSIQRVLGLRNSYNIQSMNARKKKKNNNNKKCKIKTIKTYQQENCKA